MLWKFLKESFPSTPRGESNKYMRTYILTLFPEMFDSPFNHSIIRRAQEHGLVNISVRNFRDYAHDKHHTVDDYPYGGGPGMILKPEPLFEAIEKVKEEIGVSQVPVILLSPQGRVFNQKIAQELASCPYLILICGHYEGIDERVRENLATDEISLGDFVLSGGELAAMIIVDAVVRLLPGVLGASNSPQEDSFSNGILEYPQYTRPAIYRSWSVPQVLLSGNHAEISYWRRRQALERTLKRRPDLIQKASLSEEDRKLLEEIKNGCPLIS